MVMVMAMAMAMVSIMMVMVIVPVMMIIMVSVANVEAQSILAAQHGPGAVHHTHLAKVGISGG